MKRLVSIAAIALVVALALFFSGCASVQPRLVPVAGGVGAGVNIGAQDDGFWANNWGKVLSGVAAAGGLYLVADKNGWLEGGNGSDKSTSPVAPMGDGNVVVNGTVGGDVRINYGNTESP